ncbi:hypothetical protein [Bifidobacterium panos]|uniref:K structural protein n=1 Tax=Bifidobacterium panos TaxID=2675321 RepID=A0ABX1SY63_9BIFI|nr:hypothetical protein [Bifidobacterium sp. DSM 109963]NMN02779.1 K structural protein [Bifidobacterium sp. DSM 109963]
MEFGVHSIGAAIPKDNQAWLVNGISDAKRSITLDLSTFVADKDKEADYFASLSDTDTVGYLKSGIPLARITDTNLFGPYDPKATDGRQLKIEGLLESQFRVEFTRTGIKADSTSAAMWYMAVIDTAELPYSVDGAAWGGLFLDRPKNAPVVNLSAAVAATAGTKG